MKKNKRTIFWIIPIAVIGIFYFFYGPQDDITDNDYISYIKALPIAEANNTSLDVTLTNYCEKGSWVFFKTTMRKNVVEFKGECEVENVVQPVNLQFFVNKDITEHTVGAMLVNNVQQTEEARTHYINQFYAN